jgi:hypothetical protein
MRTTIATAFILAALGIAIEAHAGANLCWDPTADGFFNLTYSQTETGPYQVLKEVPAYPNCISIAEFGFYKITVPNGGPSSNVAHFSLDVETGWQTTVAALEARVKALEGNTTPEPTTGNITAKVLDADTVEIIGLNCVKLDTNGSGLKRTVKCLH